MDTLKRIWKYVLMIVGLYILTAVFVFVGFNLNYSDMEKIGEIPEQISIEKAESTSKDARIYGYITNKEENDVNNKYIKVQAFDKNSELISSQSLKIIDLESNEKKLFKVNFKNDDISKYSIEITDNE